MNPFRECKDAGIESPMEKMPLEFDADIASLAKERDYERYVCALLAKSSKRPALLALLAFKGEIASVSEVVSEETPGVIRLKWWQEAIASIYDGKGIREHPVVRALAATIQHYPLPRECFDIMIETRLYDLNSRSGFESNREFYDYLDGTAGELHALMARVCDPELYDRHDETIFQMARHYAIIGLLRALPYHAEHAIVRWPLDILQQCGISPAAISQGQELDALHDFVSYWCDRVLEESRSIPELPASFKPINLMYDVTMIHADKLRRCNYQLSEFLPRLHSMPLRLWWRSLFA